jgi:hypothetical protein
MACNVVDVDAFITKLEGLVVTEHKAAEACSVVKQRKAEQEFLSQLEKAKHFLEDICGGMLKRQAGLQILSTYIAPPNCHH